MTKTELLEALIVERFGYLRPEYRPLAIDRAEAAQRRHLDPDPSHGAALRLIADNDDIAEPSAS